MWSCRFHTSWEKKHHRNSRNCSTSCAPEIFRELASWQLRVWTLSWRRGCFNGSCFGFLNSNLFRCPNYNPPLASNHVRFERPWPVVLSGFSMFETDVVFELLCLKLAENNVFFLLVGCLYEDVQKIHNRTQPLEPFSYFQKPSMFTNIQILHNRTQPLEPFSYFQKPSTTSRTFQCSPISKSSTTLHSL